MRRRIALLLAVGAAAAVPAVGASASSDSGAIAHAACTRAVIAGQSKCIARGQYCSRSSRAMRDYRKYGLSCTKRDRNGRYHLQ